MPRRSVRMLSVASLVLALATLVPLVALAVDGFADVDSAAFYHADANWLKERRITLGCGGNNYCPDDVVTRGQMAAFLHRAANVRETPVFSRTTLDSAGSVGRYSSATIGVDGRALISYWDVTNSNLKVAHCTDLACSAATVTTLDSAGSVGLHSSITIGADGLALISYWDLTNGDLKVAHCSNAFCVPNHRRR